MTPIIDWVVPPAGATAEEQRDWQWRIAMAIVGIYGAGSIVLAASMGLVLGVSGFARADEVAELQQFFKDYRLTQLEEQIDRVRTRQCSAYKVQNQMAMSDANSDLNRLTRMYRAVAGFDYRVKSCNELLVGAG